MQGSRALNASRAASQAILRGVTSIRQTVGMRSRVHPTYKTKYRVTNWASYDRALVRRGDITVWLSPEAIKAWTRSLQCEGRSFAGAAPGAPWTRHRWQHERPCSKSHL